MVKVIKMFGIKIILYGNYYNDIGESRNKILKKGDKTIWEKIQ